MNGWAGPAVLYETEVRHTRLRPTRYRLRQRSYYWLVDVDHLPRPPLWLRPLAGFRPEDHHAPPGGTIRGGLTAFARDSGIELDDCRITMLTQARVLGHVFNPLTVYWCRDPEGGLRCVIAEVHNTYGGHHRYLLRTDEHDRAATAKDFSVSPFLPVDGTYRMVLPPPRRHLRLTVALDLDGEPILVANLTGRRRPATARTLLATTLRHPFSTLAVTAGIRWHGIRLWARGLPLTRSTPRER